MITFVLPLPPTTNNSYKSGGGRLYKTAGAKAWEREALYYLKKSNPKQITGHIKIGIVWLLSRKRDIDGGIKIVLDALERNSIIENDDNVYELHVKKNLNTKETTPRVVINVEQIKYEQDQQSIPMGL